MTDIDRWCWPQGVNGWLAAPLLASCLLCSGCVSYSWVGPTAMSIQNPQELSRSRAFISAGGEGPPISAHELLRAWGPPDAYELLDDGSERWEYHFGLRWSGVVLVAVVLPLPLVLPVGQEWVAFEIRDGQVISATGEKDTLRLTALFGFHIGICDAGFGTEVLTEPARVSSGRYATE